MLMKNFYCNCFVTCIDSGGNIQLKCINLRHVTNLNEDVFSDARKEYGLVK